MFYSDYYWSPILEISFMYLNFYMTSSSFAYLFLQLLSNLSKRSIHWINFLPKECSTRSSHHIPFTKTCIKILLIFFHLSIHRKSFLIAAVIKCQIRAFLKSRHMISLKTIVNFLEVPWNSNMQRFLEFYELYGK